MPRLMTYRVFPTRVEQFHEQPNAKDFYLSILAFFRAEYLPATETGQDNLARLWRSMRDRSVPYCDRVVLGLLFDRSLISFEAQPMVLAALNSAARRFDRAHFRQGARALEGFAKVLQKPSLARVTPGCIGLGLGGLTADLWTDWPHVKFPALDLLKLVDGTNEQDAVIKIKDDLPLAFAGRALAETGREAHV